MTENTDEILTPDQLEPDDEHVRPLDGNRQVVSADEAGPAPAPDGGSPGHQRDTTEGLDDLDGAYALELQARHEGTTDTLRVETNDLSDAFDSLLHWYASRVAEDTQPAAVVEVLLAHSELDVDVRQR